MAAKLNCGAVGAAIRSAEATGPTVGITGIAPTGERYGQPPQSPTGGCLSQRLHLNFGGDPPPRSKVGASNHACLSSSRRELTGTNGGAPAPPLPRTIGFAAGSRSDTPIQSGNQQLQPLSARRWIDVWRSVFRDRNRVPCPVMQFAPRRQAKNALNCRGNIKLVRHIECHGKMCSLALAATPVS
jgi:hypothetical protein